MREQEVVDSRYRIERKLAAGGFGAIFAATDLVMGREVALKVLHRELAHDALLVARFRREADALARLRDPHTITMYDVGVDADGTPYIVLELLRGETLYQQFLNQGALPWRRMASIARGVCSSLREAHAAGIIHRDLKPANIHLEVSALQQDHVKVLDFGIAKVVDAADHPPLPDLTLAGQMIGTFDYMPPEQLIGATCTGKSDVFALAVVMYEMIAGELPFGPAQGPAGRLMSMLSTTPASLVERANVPPELDEIIQRALARELEDRPDMEELDAVLERLLDGTKQFVSADINAMIDQVLTEEDDGTFPEDDSDTWVGQSPPTTTIGLAPTRPPSSPPTDVATLMKPLGKRDMRPPAFEAEGTGRVAPMRDAAGTPPPEITGDRSSRFAVGSRTELQPAKSATHRVTPAHVPPPPPRRMPSPNVDPLAQTIRPEAQDPLASLDAHLRASSHLHIDARSNVDSQAQTARQPRRVLTPPSGAASVSARAEVERLANRSQLPVVRITTPPPGRESHGAGRESLMSPPHRVWQGRPTPSEMALPPAPHFTPSGELPTVPMRMATGTSPIVNRAHGISMVKVAVWALALFGVGFATVLGLTGL